jgi:hypothetical protein
VIEHYAARQPQQDQPADEGRQGAGERDLDAGPSNILDICAASNGLPVRSAT